MKKYLLRPIGPSDLSVGILGLYSLRYYRVIYSVKVSIFSIILRVISGLYLRTIL